MFINRNFKENTIFRHLSGFFVGISNNNVNFKSVEK